MFLREHRLLDVAGHREVFLELAVFIGDLALLVFENADVVAQKPVLQAHEDVDENEPDVAAELVEQDDIVVKRFAGPRENEVQNLADRLPDFHKHRSGHVVAHRFLRESTKP